MIPPRASRPAQMSIAKRYPRSSARPARSHPTQPDERRKGCHGEQRAGPCHRIADAAKTGVRVGRGGQHGRGEGRDEQGEPEGEDHHAGSTVSQPAPAPTGTNSRHPAAHTMAPATSGQARCAPTGRRPRRQQHQATVTGRPSAGRERRPSGTDLQLEHERRPPRARRRPRRSSRWRPRTREIRATPTARPPGARPT